MKRSTIFRFGDCFSPPISPDDAALIASNGMRAALSFAHRFEDMATMPLVQIHTSAEPGHPEQELWFYGNTLPKYALVQIMTRSSLVSITMTKSSVEEMPVAVCELVFRRATRALSRYRFSWALDTGKYLASSNEDLEGVRP